MCKQCGGGPLIPVQLHRYRRTARAKRLAAREPLRLLALQAGRRRNGVRGHLLLRVAAFAVSNYPPLDGACVGTLRGHTRCVDNLAVLPDGTLASGSWDKTVRLWRDGACVGTLRGHTNKVTCLAVLPDGTLASAGVDGTVRLWG